MTVLAYTHWAYFDERAAAEACRGELADYVCRIVPPDSAGDQWLLLAGRDVELDYLIERHAEVEAIVLRHGGMYDGGEGTYNGATGKPVADPNLKIN